VYQVFTMKGISKKFKKDSSEHASLFNKKGGAGSKFAHGAGKPVHDKPRSREIANKLKEKHPDKEWKEIFKMISCNNCGYTGHITEECKYKKRETAGKPQERTVYTTAAEATSLFSTTHISDLTPDKLPMSQAQMRNTSGFFGIHMTNMISKPVTEDDSYRELLRKQINESYISLDNHANIHVWTSDEHLTNVRQVRPIEVRGFGGFVKKIGTVGDHPLLGEVFIDRDNGYNIVSTDLMRRDAGYFRRTSEDTRKSFCTTTRPEVCSHSSETLPTVFISWHSRISIESCDESSPICACPSHD